MFKMNFDDLVAKKDICLSGKNLCDEDLDVLVDVLQKSKVLERLELIHNDLTLAAGKFTDALANNITLKSLYLARNHIGAEGSERLADALKINKTLQGLYLHDNKIGAEGAKHIADALVENESLEEISLNENNIGNEGANSLANCFMVNQSIREVYLYRNNISDYGAQKLIEALKWNYGIESLSCGAIGDPISEHIKAEINDLLKDPKQKMPPLIKLLREENTTMKTKLATKDQQLASIIAEKNVAEAKLKSMQDEKEATARNVKVEQEADDTTHIYNADTDDDEGGSPLGSNDTRSVKVKREADVTTNIYNADTDDDEVGIPAEKKQKTEKA